MNDGSTAGFASVNTDQYEFMTECTDIFSNPVVEKNLENGGNVFYYPTSTITEESPIE